MLRQIGHVVLLSLLLSDLHHVATRFLLLHRWLRVLHGVRWNHLRHRHIRRLSIAGLDMRWRLVLCLWRCNTGLLLETRFIRHHAARSPHVSILGPVVSISWLIRLLLLRSPGRSFSLHIVLRLRYRVCRIRLTGNMTCLWNEATYFLWRKLQTRVVRRRLVFVSMMRREIGHILFLL